jgi:hypothetical protein
MSATRRFLSRIRWIAIQNCIGAWMPGDRVSSMARRISLREVNRNLSAVSDLCLTTARVNAFFTPQPKSRPFIYPSQFDWPSKALRS